MKKVSTVVLSLLLVVSAAFCAGTQSYDKGVTFFSIKAGVNLPLAEFYPNATASIAKSRTGADCGLSAGGYAGLSYEAFIDNRVAVGGEISYAFNFSRIPSLFTIVPITAKATYVPVQKENFDLQLHVYAGFAVLKYNSTPQIAPFASCSISPVYFITDQWGIGIEANLFTTAELYSKTKQNLYPATCFAFMAPITLTATYRR